MRKNKTVQPIAPEDRTSYIPIMNIYRFEDIYRDDTLNIFSDASTRNMYTADGDIIGYTGHGAIAACKYNIINNIIRVHIGSSQVGELYALRNALELAYYYKDYYATINIFSDSLYAVKSITSYWFSWILEENTYSKPNKTGKDKIVKHPDLIHEMLLLLYEIKLGHNLNIYHQSGHVDTSKVKMVERAAGTFSRFNNIPYLPDANFMCYISSFNNLIDQMTRDFLFYKNPLEYSYRSPMVVKISEENDLWLRANTQNLL